MDRLSFFYAHSLLRRPVTAVAWTSRKYLPPDDRESLLISSTAGLSWILIFESFRRRLGARSLAGAGSEQLDSARHGRYYRLGLGRI